MTPRQPASPLVVAGFVVESLDSSDAAARLSLRLEQLAEPHRIVASFDREGAAGVELWVSGELLGMPPWIELDDPDRQTRDRDRANLREAFTAACEVLDPLYGGVDVEWELPDPRRLAGDRARLPGDFFWSAVLDTTDPALASDLAQILGRPGQQLAGGTLIEAGTLLDPSVPPPPAPLTAGRRAASRLAQALAQR